VQVVRRNAEELGLAERCTVVRQDVSRALAELSGPYDLVFSDPPYALRASQATLDTLAARELVARGGRVVLERDRREARPQAPAGFDVVDERRYGDTLVLVVQRR
jgi:16S rRNA (guanine966-N2)-methyltransferase